eukprot:356925-Chlamydomonas_euryale.AAC.11
MMIAHAVEHSAWSFSFHIRLQVMHGERDAANAALVCNSEQCCFAMQAGVNVPCARVAVHIGPRQCRMARTAMSIGPRRCQ